MRGIRFRAGNVTVGFIIEDGGVKHAPTAEAA